METVQDVSRQKKSILPSLHTSRNHYTSVVPLPTEVLQDIFILCARDHHYQYPYRPIPEPVPSWINVSHVCRGWRNVALECPTLWAYIFIASQRWTELLLARSKRTSLKMRIHLACPSRHSPGLKSVEMVMDHVERIQELSLNLPSSLIHPVFFKLSSRAPRLQDLDVIIGGSSVDWPWLLFGGDPPALHTLSLVNCSLPSGSFRPSALTVLCLVHVPDHRQQNIVEFLAALRSMRDLEYLYLDRALPPTTEFLSSMEFKTFKTIDLIHLSRLWIRAPLSTTVTLLYCTNIPLKAQFRLECLSELDSPLDHYTLLRSLFTQRYKGQVLPLPILSLAIHITLEGIILTFSPHPHPHEDTISIVYDGWDYNIPLYIQLCRITVDKDAVINDFCSFMPLSSVQTLSIVRPPFSPVFWRQILRTLQDIRCISLSDANMPDLSVLSLTDHTIHDSEGENVQNHRGLPADERGQGHVLAPKLEKLELWYIRFLPPHDSNLSGPAITLDCLFKTLSTRRLEDSSGRLAMTRCNDDRGSGMFDMVAVWGGGSCYAVSSSVHTPHSDVEAAEEWKEEQGPGEE